VNGFLRQHLAAIDCKPTERGGRRFYRAVGTANEAQMIEKSGLGDDLLTNVETIVSYSNK